MSGFPEYITTLSRDVQAGNSTEHTHRPTLKKLIEDQASGVTATNEPKRVKCGAPDFVIAKHTNFGPLTLGYVETKDVGANLDEAGDSEQLRRYRLALDNLILTDYLTFRWYRNGEIRAEERLARKTSDGVTTLEGGPTKVQLMIRDFLAQTPARISTPRELAERMARLTKLLSAVILKSFELNEVSGEVNDLRLAFSQVLLPDLSIPTFADMFSQTLAYGLFAARVATPSEQHFTRVNAALEIPTTNPFLRRLLEAITGASLESEPFVGLVDDLAQLLANTDVHAVLRYFGEHSAKSDPIVHFYETFLAAYDPTVRELRGVYYTPEPVVGYMVRSTDQLLKDTFGIATGLADTSDFTYERLAENGKPTTTSAPRVLVLDPATGTGTFLYEITNVIRERFMAESNAGLWPSYVHEHLIGRLIGFELLMAPYVVAHLKLSMQLAALDLPEAERADWAYAFDSAERLNIYLTNSLEQAARHSDLLLGRYISEEANAAADFKSVQPIMVVVGNPPYSGHSANASWHELQVKKGDVFTKRVGTRWQKVVARKAAKVKVPTFIGGLLNDYLQVDGASLGERNPKWLQDDYVKFFRFGQWRIDQTGAGVLAYITNHAYLDNPTFRGMRQCLLKSFSEIYVLDLHGSQKRRERSPDGSNDENVFDITPGVAIAILVKRHDTTGDARVWHADFWGTRQSKYERLRAETVTTTKWTELAPTSPQYLFVPSDAKIKDEYERGFSIREVFTVGSVGVVTARDDFVLGFRTEEVAERITRFAATSTPDSKAREMLGPRDKLDIASARRALRGIADLKSKLVDCAFRPFDTRRLFYSSLVVGRDRFKVMRHMLAGPNVALITARTNKSPDPDHFLCSALVTEAKLGEATTQSYTFPLYLYPIAPRLGQQTNLPGVEGQTGIGGRRANLSQRFVDALAAKTGLTPIQDGGGQPAVTFGPDDVFAFIYALVYSSSYRARYGNFFKNDFPRIPLPPCSAFVELAEAGAELRNLHLSIENGSLKPVLNFPVRGSDTIEVGYPKYEAHNQDGAVFINAGANGRRSQFFGGISPDVWRLRIGGYPVCDHWLKERRGRRLSLEELTQFGRVIAGCEGTLRLTSKIDEILAGQPFPFSE